MGKSLSLPPLSPTKDLADYALFSGSISRWIWRIYTQRLTPGGRWFALATLGFISYGGASLLLQGYILAGYTIAIWMVAIGAMIFYRPRVSVDVTLASRACAGETLPVDVVVTQMSPWRGADLVLLPHRLPMSIDAVLPDGALLPDLQRGQSTRLRVGLICQRRGVFTLRGFRVETGFPFGILRSRQTFETPHKLLVYPKFTALSRLSLPTGRRYQPGGVALASQIGESFEYLGNREYREGDNIRDIDWRATARLQKPIVREWVEEYMLRVAVILDTHVPKKSSPARRESFERAVSVSAAVSDYMARQDYLVDLFAAGPDLYHLTAGRSLAYLDQILDILACVGESEAEPFAVIEPQIAELIERLSTVICVLMDWDEQRRVFVHRLVAQGIAVKVIIVRDEPTCTLSPLADIGLLGEIPVIGADEFNRGIDEI